MKLLLAGEILNVAPIFMCLGTASLLVDEEAKLLLSWLAIGEAVEAIIDCLFLLSFWLKDLRVWSTLRILSLI
jgi:hypothetical protein